MKLQILALSLLVASSSFADLKGKDFVRANPCSKNPINPNGDHVCFGQNESTHNVYVVIEQKGGGSVYVPVVAQPGKIFGKDGYVTTYRGIGILKNERNYPAEKAVELSVVEVETKERDKTYMVKKFGTLKIDGTAVAENFDWEMRAETRSIELPEKK